MPRDSERLHSMGYYDDKGVPLISYKENLSRIFKRRKRRRGNASEMSDVSVARDTVHLPASSSRYQFRLKPALCLLVILLICFGGAYPTSVYMEMLQTKMTQLEEEMHYVTNRFFTLADSIPNFALESLGASIHRHGTSDTYEANIVLYSFWGIPILYRYIPPENVIRTPSSPLTPGKCWPFAGGQGHMLIILSQPATISHVTLGHISRLQSPDDFLSSAPRTFTVYGLRTEDGEQIRLGTFVYNRAGESLQTFKLPDLKKDVFRYVKLQINDNWGNKDYTCLYNFRVHGKTPMSALEITI